jgi:hypothetical protein
MSLGVAIKSAEGIVLAADSRVTLFGTQTLQLGLQSQQFLFPATFDNATKMLNVPSQAFVGAVTFGAGAIGQVEPRTAASFMSEFETEVAPNGRMAVDEFARALGDFFTRQWFNAGMPPNPGLPENMTFLVGGYNATEAHGRLYQVSVPELPAPQELTPGEFGATWGGQTELTSRLVNGFDPALPDFVQDALGIDPAARRSDLPQALRDRLRLNIPWQFLPLQDCVNLADFIVRTTIAMQQWLVAIRGVGGAVDVATITRSEGFRAIQIKQITTTTERVR